MDYRSERDAMRGRIESLEQDLEEAKQALRAQHDDDKAARVAQLETRLAEALAALDEARRELAAKEPHEPEQPDHAVSSTKPSETGAGCGSMIGVLVWSLTSYLIPAGLAWVSFVTRPSEQMRGAVVLAVGVALHASLWVVLRRVQRARPPWSGVPAHVQWAGLYVGSFMLLATCTVLFASLTARGERNASAFVAVLAGAYLGFAGMIVAFFLLPKREPPSSRRRS